MTSRNTRRHSVPFAIAACCALLGGFAAVAGAQQPPGMEVTAFADLVFPVSAEPDADGQIRLNQAEVDLVQEIAPDATAALALAYDPEAEGFTVAVLAAELALAGGEGLSLGATIGQFDIPFGIDYQVYASVDRRLVTTPLVIDATHEGWNDLGVSLGLAGARGGADVFVINGTSCGRGVVCADKSIVRSDVVRAFGARLHAAPVAGLEVGVSGAAFQDESDTAVMTLRGADLQAEVGRFRVKGEVVAHEVDRGTTAAAVNTGWYLQAETDFGDWFAIARYDAWDPELLDESPARLCLGLGHAFRPGLEFRLEQDLGLTDQPDATLLQMVMAFGAGGE